MNDQLDEIYEDDASPAAKYEAKQLFQEAYQAQLAENFEAAIELYKRSIETYPTAEAHTFLGWAYSFQNRYDEAIEECLEAIRVDRPSGILTTISAVIFWPRAILTAACAGSSARSTRLVMNPTPFRISTWVEFMRRGRSISKPHGTTAKHSNNNRASRKQPADFTGCKRC